MIKVSKVAVTAKDGTRHEMEIHHAERLIANYGWRLADGGYIYDRENGIRLNPNKGSDKQTGQELGSVEDEDGAKASSLPHGGGQVS